MHRNEAKLKLLRNKKAALERSEERIKKAAPQLAPQIDKAKEETLEEIAKEEALPTKEELSVAEEHATERAEGLELLLEEKAESEIEAEQLEEAIE